MCADVTKVLISAKDLKLKLPTNVDELEKSGNGHMLECFHSLDPDVINTEIKRLHVSAHLLFERAEVIENWHFLLQKFAIVKVASHLIMGKLSGSAYQKNANHKLPLE